MGPKSTTPYLPLGQLILKIFLADLTKTFDSAMNFVTISFVVGMLSIAASAQEQEFTPPYHYWQQQSNQQLTSDFRRQQTANPRQSLVNLLAAFGISPS